MCEARSWLLFYASPLSVSLSFIFISRFYNYIVRSPRFYLVHVLYSVRSPHFIRIPSPCFIPSPWSAVRSPCFILTAVLTVTLPIRRKGTFSVANMAEDKRHFKPC